MLFAWAAAAAARSAAVGRCIQAGRSGTGPAIARSSLAISAARASIPDSSTAGRAKLLGWASASSCTPGSGCWNQLLGTLAAQQQEKWSVRPTAQAWGTVKKYLFFAAGAWLLLKQVRVAIIAHETT